MAMTVGMLEEALFAAFPREDAEDWDNVGLAVGDRTAEVGRIAVALDMTAANVLAAAEAGCSVLVTHHPPFVKDAPSEFAPQGERLAPGPGRMVFEAVRNGVSCLAMHTNADRSPRVRAEFAEMLGLPCTGSFEAADGDAPGLGAVLEAPQPISLAAFAARLQKAFGGSPRVWGDPNLAISRIAVLNGSWGDSAVFAECVARGIGCAVVGETRYHSCLDARPHLAVVELGHDVSELPIVKVLAKAVAEAGIAEGDIVCVQTQANWWTPLEGE